MIENEKHDESFAEKIATHRDALKGLAIKLTGEFNDSEDLIQETILRAIRYEKYFKSGINLKPWLYTIMRNIFINDYRRNKKRKTFLNITDNIYSIGPSKEIIKNDVFNNFKRKDIQKALDKLPLKIQITIEKNMLGFQYDEIAEQLEIPIGTVKTRIFVGRRIMREILKDYHNHYD